MGLDGPSREIISEPLRETPPRPEPEREPEPVREQPVPDREKVPAGA